MSLKLTNRLQTAADFVRKNRKTADVGTDHGYLPTFLVLNGITDNAIAADIGKGPLDNARKTVMKYALEDNIKLILSDGLDNIPRDTQEIIIAGMGGTLIAEILQKAEWIKNKDMHLILQPMTHSQDVREFLSKNGFYISDEKSCTDSGKAYIVISAFYDGNDHTKDDFYYYFGDKITPESNSDIAYIKRQYSYLESKYSGALHSADKTEAEKYKNILLKADSEGLNI